MSDRPKRLYYTGRGAIPGVPRRDLEEADIARLSDAKLAEVMGKHPRSDRATYQVTAPADRKKPRKPRKPRKSPKQPKQPPAAETSEPASSGEGSDAADEGAK